MNRGLGLVLTVAGSFAAFLGVMGGFGTRTGQPSYLMDTSGIGVYSWAMAAVIAVLLILPPTALWTHWLLGRSNRLATVALAFGASVFLPVVIADDQTHRLFALVVGFSPVIAASLLAKPIGTPTTRVGLSGVLLLIHWVGLAVVLPPAADCGYEDCYRSTLWQSAIAIGCIWLGSGRLLAEPRPT